MINFINFNSTFRLRNKIKCREWIIATINSHSNSLIDSNDNYRSSLYEYQVGDINIIFTNDTSIIDLNKKILNHNWTTDIITVDYTVGALISADLFISIDTVKENSKKYNTPFILELHRVIIHGILHLLSFNDSTPQEVQQMRELENSALKQYDLLIPYLKYLS